MTESHPLLEGLNRSQRAAVTAPAGPILVFAGAGSGKTRTLTRRIAWIVAEQGRHPLSVLAMTFTNKAAREMNQRVAQLAEETGVFEPAPGPWVSTFHAFALRLLRLFPEPVGLASGFGVLGADDSKALLRQAARGLGVNEDRHPLRAIVPAVSARRNAVAATGRWEGPAERFPGRNAVVAEVATALEAELARIGAVDFDGMQILALRLLRKGGGARDFVDRRAQRLLVDEYQDTSPLQQRLLLELAPHRDVFAVGDDDQSIYSFRGADHRNILRFEKDFPGARVFRLEQNYRSTAAILDAANAVIRRNRERRDKTLRAMGERGAPIRFLRHASEAGEAARVAQDIEGWKDERGSVAVLLRTRAQTRAFEEAFTARGIRHVVIGGLRFYERKEVLDALAWIGLAASAGHDAGFRRAIAAPRRGIGAKSLSRIEGRAGADRIPLLEAARRLVNEGAFSGRVATGLRSFLRAVGAIRKATADGPEAVVRTAIEGSGLAASLENDSERTENLASLRAAARDFETRAAVEEEASPDSDGAGADRAGADRVLAFLDQVSLLAAEDLAPDEEEDSGPPPVRVMTVHAAKGLEFDRVFLAGLWQGVFPHWLALQHNEIEEERRLFYVGMTRARNELFLSAAPGAMTFRSRSGPGNESRFLRDIPGLRRGGGRGRRRPSNRPRPGGASLGGLRRGHRVVHPKFGLGRVESVDAAARRITVVFERAGRKRLVPEYAQLRRLP